MAANKIVAIYDNHQTLKDVLDALNHSGYQKEDVSVLVKRQPDESTEHLTGDVRAYSTATYPETRIDSFKTSHRVDYQQPELHDTQAYATQTGQRVLDTLPLMSPGATGATVGGAESVVPALENTGVSDIDNQGRIYSQNQALDTDIVMSNRLDKNISEHHDVAVKDPNALTKDALAGGAIGFLAGAVALLVPGIGPVLATGPIAAAMGALAAGTALGTTAGALVGLFQDEGIPSDRVGFYRQAFEEGKAIVIVKLKETEVESRHADFVYDLLNQHYPEQVERIS